jgi:hypothetical protein
MRLSDLALCVCIGIACYACGHTDAYLKGLATSDQSAVLERCNGAELHLAQRLERVEQLQARIARRLGVVP